MKRTIAGIVGGLAVLVFVWLVWPTPYHYRTWHWSDFTTPVRISRFTGQADFLAPDGWHRMAPVDDPLTKIEKELGLPPYRKP